MHEEQVFRLSARALGYCRLCAAAPFAGFMGMGLVLPILGYWTGVDDKAIDPQFLLIGVVFGVVFGFLIWRFTSTHQARVAADGLHVRIRKDKSLPWSDMTHIRAYKTQMHGVRAIHIWRRRGPAVRLNMLDDMERLISLLEERSGLKVSIKNSLNWESPVVMALGAVLIPLAFCGLFILAVLTA